MEREAMRAILAKLSDWERSLVRVKCEDQGRVYLSDVVKHKLSEGEQKMLVEALEDPQECEQILDLLKLFGV